MKKETVDKKLVEHLAELSRIDLGDDAEKITDDLKEIIGYFEVLNEADIKGVEPVSGGTALENEVREDKYDEKKKLDGGEAVRAFPDKKDGYLKVPPVFE